MARLPYSHIFSIGPSLLLSQQVRRVPCGGACVHALCTMPACFLLHGSGLVWGVGGAYSLRRTWLLLISCWSFWVWAMGGGLNFWSRPESKPDVGPSTRGVFRALSGFVRGILYTPVCGKTTPKLFSFLVQNWGASPVSICWNIFFICTRHAC